LVPSTAVVRFIIMLKKNNWERFIFLVNKPDHKSIKFIQTSNLASFLIKFCVLFKFLETVLPTEKEKKSRKNLEMGAQEYVLIVIC